MDPVDGPILASLLGESALCCIWSFALGAQGPVSCSGVFVLDSGACSLPGRKGNGPRQLGGSTFGDSQVPSPVCSTVGPCALEYTKMKTADHFWTDPSADELVQRHRIHSSHLRQDSPTKRPALCVR